MSNGTKWILGLIAAILLTLILSSSMLIALQKADQTPASTTTPQDTTVPEASAEPENLTQLPTPAPTPTSAVYDLLHLGEIGTTVTKQEATDAGLLQALENGEYTFESPYVQLDPYGESPLTAIALFQTDTPARISVHVQGDTLKADVDFTFDSYTTRHTIPILGLYPDRVNSVILTATGQDGAQNETVLEIVTEPLPSFFTRFVLIAETVDEANYAEGLNFPSMGLNHINYPFAFDCNGAIRWYLPNYINDIELFFFRDCKEGFIIGKGDHRGDTSFSVINVLGKVFAYYYSPLGSHHDLFQTDHDSWIVTGSEPEHRWTVEDILYEISTVNGRILNILDFKTVLERTRTYGHAEFMDNVDWMHMNSVVEYQGDMIVSSNFQSLVLRVDWDGQIQWMLTDPTGYLEMYQQYMLQPIGDDFEWPYNQHAIQILPDQDQNDDTVDILLFDNGSSRSIVNEDVDADYSRLVQYRIHEKERTVEQVWSYGKNHLELFSYWCGDANLLGNGNILGTFAVEHTGDVPSHHGIYLEVNRNGKLIWECLAQSVFENNEYYPYRCERMNIYTENITDLHLGEIPRIVIPDQIWGKYGISPVPTATFTAAPSPAPTAAATVAPEAAAVTEETVDAVWMVTVLRSDLLDTLHTDTNVLQYDGSTKTVTYDNAPAKGMRYALFHLEVTKELPIKSTFDWADLTLVLADGSAYSRAKDTFLTDHGYERISGTKLSLGAASGYACFEIPGTANLSGAAFVYTQEGAAFRYPIP